MNPKIDTSKAWTEVILFEECAVEKFHKVARVLEEKYDVVFKSKINDIDSLYWEFDYNDSLLVLFYNFKEGISLFPYALYDASDLANTNTYTLGNQLYTTLLFLDWTLSQNTFTDEYQNPEENNLLQIYEHTNNARIIFEEQKETQLYSIHIEILGTAYHTHHENSREKAEEYILWTKYRINKIFDLYEIPKLKRTEKWHMTYDTVIHELQELS